MGQAAEHDMRHEVELVFEGGVESGVIVSMDHGPPGGHPVQQSGSVGEGDPDAFCAGHMLDGQGVIHGGIGVPELFVIDGELLGVFYGSHSRRYR